MVQPGRVKPTLTLYIEHRAKSIMVDLSFSSKKRKYNILHGYKIFNLIVNRY